MKKCRKVFGRLFSWEGVPDAIIYDKLDHTYIAIKYKYVYPLSFEDFIDEDFVKPYNKTIHVMNVITQDEQDFTTIYQVMKEYKCEFDLRIQTQYNEQYKDLDLKALLTEIYQLDEKFVTTEGQHIRDDFFKDYNNQDYSKYKYDQQFIQEFYQFVESNAAKNCKVEWTRLCISNGNSKK